MYKVSLIMCTRNRPQILLRFVESLWRQTRQIDEFVIIDSSDNPLNNTDEYSKMLELFPSIIFEHSEPGLTLQRNRGVQLITGDIAFFFDDDIVLEPNYIELVMDVFENDADYAGGMGQIPVKPLNTKQKIELVFNKLFMLPHKFGDGRFYPSGFAKMPHGSQELKQVEVLSGGIAAYKSHVLREFAFDEYFKGYGFLEDAEYSRRVSVKHKLFYQPKAVCHHLHMKGGRGNPEELGKMIAHNFNYIFNRHFRDGGFKNYLAHSWSFFGLVISGMIFNKNLSLVKGYLIGISSKRR